MAIIAGPTSTAATHKLTARASKLLGFGENRDDVNLFDATSYSHTHTTFTKSSQNAEDRHIKSEAHNAVQAFFLEICNKITQWFGYKSKSWTGRSDSCKIAKENLARLGRTLQQKDKDSIAANLDDLCAKDEKYAQEYNEKALIGKKDPYLNSDSNKARKDLQLWHGFATDLLGKDSADKLKISAKLDFQFLRVLEPYDNSYHYMSNFSDPTILKVYNLKVLQHLRNQAFSTFTIIRLLIKHRKATPAYLAALLKYAYDEDSEFRKEVDQSGDSIEKFIFLRLKENEFKDADIAARMKVAKIENKPAFKAREIMDGLEFGFQQNQKAKENYTSPKVISTMKKMGCDADYMASAIKDIETFNKYSQSIQANYSIIEVARILKQISQNSPGDVHRHLSMLGYDAGHLVAAMVHDGFSKAQLEKSLLPRLHHLLEPSIVYSNLKAIGLLHDDCVRILNESGFNKASLNLLDDIPEGGEGPKDLLGRNIDGQILRTTKKLKDSDKGGSSKTVTGEGLPEDQVAIVKYIGIKRDEQGWYYLGGKTGQEKVNLGDDYKDTLPDILSRQKSGVYVINLENEPQKVYQVTREIDKDASARSRMLHRKFIRKRTGIAESSATFRKVIELTNELANVDNPSPSYIEQMVQSVMTREDITPESGFTDLNGIQTIKESELKAMFQLYKPTQLNRVLEISNYDRLCVSIDTRSLDEFTTKAILHNYSDAIYVLPNRKYVLLRNGVVSELVINRESEAEWIKLANEAKFLNRRVKILQTDAHKYFESGYIPPLNENAHEVNEFIRRHKLTTLVPQHEVAPGVFVTRYAGKHLFETRFQGMIWVIAFKKFVHELCLMHKKGWVNRDLGPHNLAYGEDGVVRNFDFGTMGQVGKLKRSRCNRFTPDKLVQESSVENAQNKGDLAVRIDQYMMLITILFSTSRIVREHNDTLVINGITYTDRNFTADGPVATAAMEIIDRLIVPSRREEVKQFLKDPSKMIQDFENIFDWKCQTLI